MYCSHCKLICKVGGSNEESLVAALYVGKSRSLIHIARRQKVAQGRSYTVHCSHGVAGWYAAACSFSPLSIQSRRLGWKLHEIAFEGCHLMTQCWSQECDFLILGRTTWCFLPRLTIPFMAEGLRHACLDSPGQHDDELPEVVNVLQAHVLTTIWSSPRITLDSCQVPKVESLKKYIA